MERTHESFTKQRRWRVKENIERRLGENVILRTRQVDDGGARPYQRERERDVRAGLVKISKRGKKYKHLDKFKLRTFFS